MLISPPLSDREKAARSSRAAEGSSPDQGGAALSHFCARDSGLLPISPGDWNVTRELRKWQEEWQTREAEVAAAAVLHHPRVQRPPQGVPALPRRVTVGRVALEEGR